MKLSFPFSIVPQQDDERFMLEALKEAWKAFQEGEVPIGAVLVLDRRVISRGYNQVELLQDATAHAEMLCLTSGAASLNNWRLQRTTLYTTVEPCCMCAGALMLSRVEALVYGAPDIRHGAGSLFHFFDTKYPTHEIQVRKGVLENEAASLLKQFFQMRRSEIDPK